MTHTPGPWRIEKTERPTRGNAKEDGVNPPRRSLPEHTALHNRKVLEQAAANERAMKRDEDGEPYEPDDTEAYPGQNAWKNEAKGEMLYIWKLPHHSPQEALGLFTFAEASKFLGISEDSLALELDSGAMEIGGFHVEFDN